MPNEATPSLAGSVALVTGANSGIGWVTARELAKMGAHVFLACRSEAKTRPVIDEIKRDAPHSEAEFLLLDLSDFASVRRCAQMFLERNLGLKLLINNAGLAGGRGLTKSGFELAFGTNYVGHFLLTKLLLEAIKQSAPARIVNVTSEAHFRPKAIDFEAVRRSTRSPTGVEEYGVSKLANLLFSVELAHQLQGTGVSTYAVHPGVVASDIWRRVPFPIASIMKLFMLSNEEGAQTTLYCATSPEVANQTGLYYDRCRVAEPSRLARDPGLAAELWRRSEEWTSQAH
jgi:retinol dehydrogenase-12